MKKLFIIIFLLTTSSAYAAGHLSDKDKKATLKCTGLYYANSMIPQGTLELDKIVYSIFSPPRNMPEDIDLPRHRAYEIKDGKRYFVESDEPESGRLVDEVLEEEGQGREGRG